MHGSDSGSGNGSGSIKVRVEWQWKWEYNYNYSNDNSSFFTPTVEISSAVAGFGDGINSSYLLPGSGGEGVANLSSTSNVESPGVWLFRTDGESIVSGGEEIGGCSITCYVLYTLVVKRCTLLSAYFY